MFQTKAAEVNFDEVSLLRERVVQLTENLLELQRENEQLKEVGRQQVKKFGLFGMILSGNLQTIILLIKYYLYALNSSEDD